MHSGSVVVVLPVICIPFMLFLAPDFHLQVYLRELQGSGLDVLLIRSAS
jgi:hypothetical protein